jgi:hypothetical protein
MFLKYVFKHTKKISKIFAGVKKSTYLCNVLLELTRNYSIN